MIVKEKTTKKTDGLSLLGVYFLTAYYCIPFFMDLLNPWIPAILGLIIIFLDFSNGKIQTKETIPFLLCTLALFVVYYLFWYQGDVATSLALFVTAILSLLPCYMFKIVVERFSKQAQKHLLVFIGLCIGFVMLNTGIALIENPEVTRNISKTSELSRKNIAVFNYSYAFGAVFLLFFVALLNQKIKKEWAIIGMCISLLFVFLVQYTSLLLLVALSIPVYFMIQAKDALKKLSILLGIIIVLVLLPILLKFLIQVMGSNTLAEHLIELYNLIVYGDSSGAFLTSRENVYSEAWKIFLKSPIWGVSVRNFDGILRKDAAHAEFLAFLSNSGVIGFMAIHLQIYFAHKCLKTVFNCSKVFKYQYLVIFLFCYLSGWLNNFSSCYELHFMSFFFAPLFLKYFIKQEKEVELGDK